MRPVLIIQNNIGNRYSPTVIIAPITAKLDKSNIPTHVSLPTDISKLEHNSMVLLEQIRTIDKTRLNQHIASLSNEFMQAVDKALMISVGLAQKSTT